MAKRKTPATTASKAASVAGRALGAVAGRFDALKARHPHPLTEAGNAIGRGEARARALAAEARSRTGAAVAAAKAVANKTTQAVKRAGDTGSKAVADARKATAKATKRATKAVDGVKKTVARGTARLKR